MPSQSAKPTPLAEIQRQYHRDIVETAANPPPAAPAPTTKLSLRTADDLLASIPKSWRSAEIAVADVIGNCHPIKRVSLHKNHQGRRVVLIHEYDFS